MSEHSRWTYLKGSRPEGFIVYDDGQKGHSNHDTDPARGQTNAYDLVRLHKFGELDKGCEGLPLADRPSSRAMAQFVATIAEVRAQVLSDEGFEDLDATDTSWLDEPAVGVGLSTVDQRTLPESIVKASSKYTDQENARRIQRRFGSQLVSIGKTFFSWTGTHWAKDDSRAIRLITNLSRIVKGEALAIEKKAKDEKRDMTELEESQFGQALAWAAECGQKAKISNCDSLLRSLLSFEAKHLNVAPNLFSCANGTIDLTTGDLKPHDPKDFITACSPISYDPAAEAPRFKRFLNEIYNGSEEVADFAKRWFGYCLTGSTNEHKLVFHVGRGGNGKSTLMDLLKHVLGEGYYSTAPQKILTLEEQGATPELANLLGKRMVTIAETDESLELREGLVKQITGGDPISARNLFKDPFEFMPTHKLQVFTNFTPMVKSQDFAMWRRILLLNYPISYGDAIQVASGDATALGDPHLDDALKAEAPGVLRWLVEGARDWYQGRLRPPPSVLEATHKYRLDQDIIGQFAKERIEVDGSARTALAGAIESVFPAYRSWCNGVNVRPLGRTRFVRELLRVCSTAKYTSWKEGTTSVSGFTGIRLTSESFTD